ncbi:hypothetical protein ACFLY9_01780 [Patescibacteria group bacterium]
MSKKWAYIIAFTVFVIIVLSSWEIFKAFEGEKEVTEYETYAESISRDFHTDLLEKIKEMQSYVLVEEKDIEVEE